MNIVIYSCREFVFNGFEKNQFITDMIFNEIGRYFIKSMESRCI